MKNHGNGEHNNTRDYMFRVWGLVIGNAVGLVGLYLVAHQTDDWNSWANVVAVWVLGLASLNVVIISALTSSEMIDTMRHQEIEITKQREATQKQLAVMDKQFIQTQNIFITNIMPAIVVTESVLKLPIDSGEFPVAHLAMVNKGNGLANDVGVSYACDLLAGTSLEKMRRGVWPDSKFGPPGNTRSVFAVDALKNFQTPDKHTYSEGHFDAVMLGLMVFYIWGEFRYADLLGNRYVTEFCLFAERLNDVALSYTTARNRIIRISPEEHTAYEENAEIDRQKVN